MSIISGRHVSYPKSIGPRGIYEMKCHVCMYVKFFGVQIAYHIRNGITLWGNGTNSCKVLTLQKSVIRIMSEAEPRASCRGLFQKLELLPVPCQYTLSTMLCIVDNPNNLQTCLEMPGLHTRSKNQLSIPITNFTSVQKGITYSDIKIYNSLPNNTLNFKIER